MTDGSSGGAAPATGTTGPAPGAGSPGGSPGPGEPAGGPAGGEQQPGQQPAGESGGEGEASGEATGSATPRPGGASDRRRRRDTAEQVINGDMFSGDKFVFLLGEGKDRLYRFPPSEEERIREAFVPPAGWDELRRRFRERRSTILVGERGQGRTAVAVKLLHSAGAEVIYNLGPDTDLGRLGEWIERGPNGGSGIDDHAAFLICMPEDIGRLRGSTFQSHEDVLTKADARLVIILDKSTPIPDADLLAARIDAPARPDLREIVKSHLILYSNEWFAEQMLADQSAQWLMTNLLDATSSCDQANQLAYQLSLKGVGSVDVERILGLFTRRSTDAFAIWFDSLPDTNTRAFAIALAVLHNLAYEEVVQAAARLSRLLDPTGRLVFVDGELAVRPAQTDPFQAPRGHQLARLRAETEHRVEPDGGVPMTAVRFKDGDEFARQVVDRAWQEYAIQDKLLDWLDELIVHASEQAESQAAATLGRLAIHAFDYLRPRLDTWAGSANEYRRRAVADALANAAKNERLRASIEELVAEWYVNRRSPYRQATAARVYGTGVGHADADTVLTTFDRLATLRFDRPVDPTERLAVMWAIGHGLADFATSDPARVLPAIYQLLRRWFNDPDRSDTGQLGFLVVANGLVVADGSARETARWPALLHVAERYDHLRDPLFMLWRGVVRFGAFEPLAEYVMTGWATTAEGDPELLVVFSRMIRATAANDVHFGHFMNRLAAQWVDEYNLKPLPAAARAVTAVLR